MIIINRMTAVADLSDLHIFTDEFSKYKQYERQIEHADVMIEYLKVELRSLERELLHAQEEVYLIYFIIFKF